MIYICKKIFFKRKEKKIRYKKKISILNILMYILNIINILLIFNNIEN